MKAVILVVVLALAVPSGALAANDHGGEVYQGPDAFVAQAFAGNPPAAEAVWLTSPLKEQVETVLGHRAASLRVRYWRDGARTAWVLDEIGKELPITTGFVVHDGRIERVRVLVFRESRGWEVRYDFFTDQFQGATMNGNGELDRHIDGITGATLSVRAVIRLAELALLLDRHVNTGGVH